MDYQSDDLVKSVAFDDDYSVMEFRKKAMVTKNHASFPLYNTHDIEPYLVFRFESGPRFSRHFDDWSLGGFPNSWGQGGGQHHWEAQCDSCEKVLGF